MPLQRNIKQDHERIEHMHTHALTPTHPHTHTEALDHNFCPQWEFLQHMDVEKLITYEHTPPSPKARKNTQISSTNLLQRPFVYQLPCPWKLQTSINISVDKKH